MNNEKYQLRYLPIFFEDVKEIVLYIKNELSNEKAANDLIDAVENAILQRLPVCESFEPYHSKKERKYLYYIFITSKRIKFSKEKILLFKK